MRLLFIGGTAFVGRHAVERAVADGHEVTVFHRGRTNADLGGGLVEHRHGDRATGDYGSLATDETWDAMIDTCAYFPRAVDQLADAVAGRVGHCVHISSISAYDDAAVTPDESAPVHGDLTDPSVEEVTNDTYGPLKAMCERAASARFGAEHTSIVRPTYVVGPHDRSDRFTYWVRRMSRGGDVALIFPDAPLQVVDGRDLGAFIVHCAVERIAGAFDGVGPWAPLRDVLAIAATATEYRLVDVGADAVVAAEVDLPMLSPEGEAPALMARPGTAARAAGLTTRPFAETIADLRAWDVERGEPPLIAGPSAEQEAALLAAGGREDDRDER